MVAKLDEFGGIPCSKAIEHEWHETGANAFTEPYGFTGKEYEKDLGITYFGARFYNPQTTRWLSPDPLYLILTTKNAEKDQNVYCYASNNPLKFVDPDGRLSIAIFDHYNAFSQWKSYLSQYGSVNKISDKISYANKYDAIFISGHNWYGNTYDNKGNYLDWGSAKFHTSLVVHSGCHFLENKYSSRKTNRNDNFIKYSISSFSNAVLVGSRSRLSGQRQLLMGLSKGTLNLLTYLNKLSGVKFGSNKGKSAMVVFARLYIARAYNRSSLLNSVKQDIIKNASSYSIFNGKSKKQIENFINHVIRVSSNIQKTISKKTGQKVSGMVKSVDGSGRGVGIFDPINKKIHEFNAGGGAGYSEKTYSIDKNYNEKEIKTNK